MGFATNMKRLPLATEIPNINPSLSHLGSNYGNTFMESFWAHLNT